jgi:hypothetical protein
LFLSFCLTDCSHGT